MELDSTVVAQLSATKLPTACLIFVMYLCVFQSIYGFKNSTEYSCRFLLTMHLDLRIIHSHVLLRPSTSVRTNSLCEEICANK